MSYKSPVTLLLDSFDEKVIDNVYQIVNHYFVDVDKDELLKALRYDRDQYNRGRLDGYLEAKKEIVYCKDCRYFGEADSKKPEYHECKYFSDWVTVHYMLENDYCSCVEPKEKE